MGRLGVGRPCSVAAVASPFLLLLLKEVSLGLEYNGFDQGIPGCSVSTRSGSAMPIRLWIEGRRLEVRSSSGGEGEG